jgi:UDP-glucose 4-epimerase
MKTPLCTVLITGASGFVGSVMCARLSELGYNVVAVDNNARGLNDVSRLPHVSFIERDCRDGIVDLLSATAPRFVCHFAAATGDLSRPLEELRALNVEMTKRLFIETMHCSSATFLFPTTSLAYGVPDSSYVQTKEEAIDWLKQQSAYRTRLLLFRFFNNAGAYRGCTELRRHEVHLIPRLWHAYLNDDPVTINGNDYDTHDGTPARDYIHVLDTVDWMIYCWRLHRSGRLHGVGEDGLIEVGQGTPHTVLDVIGAFDQAITTLGLRSSARPRAILIGPRRAFDVGSLHCTRAHFLHAWRPLKPLAEIVRDEVAALSALTRGSL